MSLYEHPRDNPFANGSANAPTCPLGYQIHVQADPTCEDWFLWVVVAGDEVEAEGEDDNPEACYNAALKAAQTLALRNRRHSFNPYHPDHGEG